MCPLVGQDRVVEQVQERMIQEGIIARATVPIGFESEGDPPGSHRQSQSVANQFPAFGGIVGIHFDGISNGRVSLIEQP